MKLIFALLLIIFLAFSGYHLSFRCLRLPLFARRFYLTGTEFLFLGLLLGPQFFNLFDTETQMGLAPLADLLLGWIGLLFGFQFEIKKLRRFPAEYLLAAVMEGLLTLSLVFSATYLTLPLLIDISASMRIVASITLAAAAACTAQTGLALMAGDSIAGSPRILRLLRYISGIDGLSALLVFGLAFTLCHTGSSDPWPWAIGKVAAVNLGASMGLLFLFTLFLALRLQESELVLVVIGMALLTSGMASALNFSPLLANFFVGFWVVNLSRKKERIYHILVTVEKPTYLMLLLFLGVHMRLESLWIPVLAAGYCFYRSLGKLLAGFLVTRLTPDFRQYPRFLGFGLLDQGGLPLAILLDFHRGFPGRLTEVVITFALLAVIFNDFLSQHFLQRLLKMDK